MSATKTNEYIGKSLEELTIDEQVINSDLKRANASLNDLKAYIKIQKSKLAQIEQAKQYVSNISYITIARVKLRSKTVRTGAMQWQDKLFLYFEVFQCNAERFLKGVANRYLDMAACTCLYKSPEFTLKSEKTLFNDELSKCIHLYPLTAII